jgi:hypothetical protein
MVEEINVKYEYVKDYLYYKILIDELKDLLNDYKICDPKTRMIS